VSILIPVVVYSTLRRRNYPSHTSISRRRFLSNSGAASTRLIFTIARQSTPYNASQCAVADAFSTWCNATRTLEPGIVSTLSKYRHSFGILLASKTYVVSPPSIDTDDPKLQRRRPPESHYDECSSQQTARRMWVTKAMHLISQLFFLVFVRGPYFAAWDFRLRLRIFQDLGLDSRRCSTLSGYNTTILERSNEKIAQIGATANFHWSDWAETHTARLGSGISKAAPCPVSTTQNVVFTSQSEPATPSCRRLDSNRPTAVGMAYRSLSLLAGMSITLSRPAKGPQSFPSCNGQFAMTMLRQ
jgi:hypothetical protein